MNESELSNNEYSAQYYEYTPLSFSNNLKRSIKSIYNNLFKLQEEIVVAACEEKIDDIKENFQKANELFDLSTEECFKKLEPNAKKFFTIPTSVEVNAGIYNNYENKLDEYSAECNSLEKKLKQQKMFTAILQKEKEEMEHLLGTVNKLVESLDESAGHESRVARVLESHNKLPSVLSEEMFVE